MVQDPTRAVTVGMPVYNDPEGLRRSIPTIFSQTWSGPVRLLLVDDGSDRETTDAIAELAATFGDVDVIRNERNRGRPYARNQILDHAGDGFLAWLDAGDLWHPRKLELQMAALDRAEEDEPGLAPVICVSPLRRYFLDRKTSSVMVPDVEGDQLLSAMTGRLFAYLPTMLGRVDAFRKLGFDERLLRRQDHDFLVRFLAEGGRVVSTAPDLPLFTYLKSDVGADARMVARVNRVIREKHAPYYRRYGREVASQIQRNQHNLVARFHAANGARLQATAYRWLARLAGPAPLTRWARRVAGRVLRPLRGPLARLAPRLATIPGLVRILDRLGLVDVARRILARRGTADAETQDTTPAGLRATRALVRSGDQVRAIEDLEVTVAEPLAPVDAWLLLEEAYRRGGRLHSADETLDRGLGQHPGDHRLRARLVELSGLRHDWERCAEEWRSLVADGDADGALTATTFRRAACSLHALELPEEALRTARAGLRRWPGDEQLDDELRRNRALTIDWASAVFASGAHPGPGDEVGGIITDLGFLEGGGAPIEGEIPLRSRHAPRVSLLLNGRELASTVAAPGPDTDAPTGRFSLNCRDVVDYLGDGDVLTIECDGSPVLTPDGRTQLFVAPGYESRSALLFEKLDAGHVFMKFGRLTLGNTPGRKRAILDLYAEVASFFERELGYTLFPFYGNLLGAIRDHDFIEHDVGGFDVAYVSADDAPDLVRAEFARIARLLAAHDYYVELHPWSLYVRRARGDKVFIDVNYAWFDPHGGLHASYGWRFQPVTDRAAFFQPRQGAISGQLVPVPGNAEAVLAQLYGDHWAIPLQGFDPDAGITRDDRYLMTRTELEALEADLPDRIRVRSVLTASGEVAYVG
jgi:glycosyltransferase involved in cell wall biosynthesis